MSVMRGARKIGGLCGLVVVVAVGCDQSSVDERDGLGAEAENPAGGKHDHAEADPEPESEPAPALDVDPDRCVADMDLRAIWARFGQYDTLTVLGRDNRYADRTEIELRDGPDGILFNEHEWRSTIDLSLDALRNSEYGGLAEEFNVYGDSEAELSMASFNLVQEYFDQLDEWSSRGWSDDAITIAAVDQYLAAASDAELQGRFALVFNEVRGLQDDIVRDGHAEGATESDVRWAERYAERRADLMCFAAVSLGLPLDDRGMITN